MAGRIRSIKPELLEDEAVATLSHGAWRLFVSLFLLADDYGNARGDARYLAGAVYWGRNDVAADEVSRFLAELSPKLVTVYDVRGQRYVALRGWEKHQRVDHPGKPRVPGLDDTDAKEIDIREGLGNFREGLAKPTEGLAPDLRSPTSDHDPDHDLSLQGSPPAVQAGLPGVPVPAPSKPMTKAQLAAKNARGEAEKYIDWFNRNFGRDFRVVDKVVRDVRTLLAKDYTQKELRMVAWYKRSVWNEDEKMRKFLRPETLLRPSKFDGYLDEARSDMYKRKTEGR